MNVVIVFGFGSFSSYVLYRSEPIVRIFEPAQFLIALATTVFNAPIVWSYFLWQPKATEATLEKLWKNDVIRVGEHDFRRQMDELLVKMRHPRWLLLSAVIAVAFFVLQALFVFPYEGLVIGRPYFWYYDKIFFYALFFPMITANYFAGVVVAIRGIISLVWFYEFFRTVSIRVRPLDPDEAGGFGHFGSLIIRYALLCVAYGEMVAILALARYLLGSDPLTVDLLIAYVLYLAFTPVILFAPLLSIHRAMKSYRNRLLEKVSARFDLELAQKDGDVRVTQEKLDAVSQTRDLIKQGYKVWPVSAPLLRRFSLTYLVPILTALIPVLIERYLFPNPPGVP